LFDQLKSVLRPIIALRLDLGRSGLGAKAQPVDNNRDWNNTTDPEIRRFLQEDAAEGRRDCD